MELNQIYILPDNEAYEKEVLDLIKGFNEIESKREELKFNRKLLILMSIMIIVLFGICIGNFVVILQLKNVIDNLIKFGFLFLYFE